MILRRAEKEVRDTLDELLDTINASDELVLILRDGFAIGGLVTGKVIEELRERRIQDGWELLDENTKRTGVMDDDLLMDLINEEVKTVRAESYAEQRRIDAKQPDLEPEQ